MAAEVRMPQLGESVTEGTVVRWLKQPGDHVALDESLAEIETEKVNVEIPSPFAGTLAQLLVPEGETVEVGTLLATIDTADAPAQAHPAAARPAQPAAAGDAPPPATAQPAVAANTGRVTASLRQPATNFTVAGSLGPANPAHGMFSTGESDAIDDAGAAGLPMATPVAPVNGAGAEGRYSPAVLRLAREHNVDLARLAGTGAGGRITRKDVQSYIDRRGEDEGGGASAPAFAAPGLAEERQLFAAGSAVAVEPSGGPEVRAVAEAFGSPSSGPSATPATEPVTAAPPTAATRPPAARPLAEDEELEPLTSTRRVIAAHMTRSVQTSPHAWMMVEVDLTRLVAFRAGVREEFRAREGVDLTYLPFMIKATVAALKQHRRLNSSWSDEGVILKRRINIGVAVDTPQGLVVPVIHHADDYSIAGLARRTADLAARARSRRLKLDEVQGGTFTVDNVGPIGSIVSQPIINQPQCAIVTMESVVKRPVVIDDAIAIRAMMNCCISFDHRIVDGGDIGPFMKTLKAGLEAMGAETPLY